MKIMVTGAGGFLGAAVARAAIARGHEVLAVARQAEPERLRPILDRLALVRADVADAEESRRMITDHRPDVIVHSAWAGLSGASRASSDQISKNLVPTAELVEAAAAAGVGKFVGIGSQAEYGRLDRRITEEDLTSPTSLYGAAKVAACALGSATARSAGMAFAWLRVFAVYGPGDNPNWLIPNLIAKLSAGERPQLTQGTQKWDYLFIDDAADAVVAVATQPSVTGIFNLSSGSPVAVREIVEKIRDRVAPGLELRFGEVPFGPDQIMHLEGAVDKLHAAVGWAPSTSLDEGLSRTIDAMTG